MNYLGIDPGKSGAMAIVDEDGQFVSVFKLTETNLDVWLWLEEQARDGVNFGVLEKVHAMPRQGVSSTFKFGTSFGLCLGLLAASGIRHELVTPAKWQRAMSCMTGGDKNVSKARAQALFPTTKVTHAIADALLLADYARRLRNP